MMISKAYIIYSLEIDVEIERGYGGGYVDVTFKDEDIGQGEEGLA